MFLIANMLLLLSLPTRKTRGTKPLIDYSKSHVVTSNQYLGILRQKAMQKEVANKGREIRSQKKEAKTTHQVTIATNANIMRILARFLVQCQTVRSELLY
jgi:hypothetical protein